MFVISHMYDQVPLERGSSIGKKKSSKKGASGTRGEDQSLLIWSLHISNWECLNLIITSWYPYAGLTPLGERARVSLLRSHGVQNLQGRAEQEELVSNRDDDVVDDDDDVDDNNDNDADIEFTICNNKTLNQCL